MILNNERYFFYNNPQDSLDHTDSKVSPAVDGPDTRPIQAEKNDQLLEAVREGQPNRVKWLLGQGAEVNCVNQSDYTPFALAVSYQRIPTVKSLIQAGADVHWDSKSVGTLLHIAGTGPAGGSQLYVFDSRSAESITALVTVLVEAGANVDAKDYDDETALHRVLTARTAQVLISAGADNKCRNKDGDTPLHFIWRADIARRLIHAGADPTARNKQGKIPLDIWRDRERFDRVDQHTLDMIAFYKNYM